MNAYWPPQPSVLFWLALVLAVILAAGFVFTRLCSVALVRMGVWGLAIGGGLLAERLTALEPPGLRMIAIILAVLYGMKAVVGVESGIAGEPKLNFLQWLAFAIGWFGMRPALFADLGRAARSGIGSLARQGLVRLLAGSALILLARLVWIDLGSRDEAAGRLLATVLLLLGLSLFLHFGVFGLLAALWRWAGVDCRPLFRAPLESKSLTEFWGRRWNLAFSEMTAIAIYRPLSKTFGRRAATAAAFLFSGLLHELAISVPVRGGYGGPLFYFLIHGGLVLVEGHWERTGRPIYRHALLGRSWTALWLLLPLPILLHYPFLNGIIWPLLGMET